MVSATWIVVIALVCCSIADAYPASYPGAFGQGLGGYPPLPPQPIIIPQSCNNNNGINSILPLILILSLI